MAERTDYSTINEGLALYAQGQAWAAHEAWEAVWKKSGGSEKRLLQVLIQVAAAVVKHQQNTPGGVQKNLKKAADNLANIPSAACLGFDLVGLRAARGRYRLEVRPSRSLGMLRSECWRGCRPLS
ncbi:MAG: DUF309 domain-containing protein [Myxococcota bacterium]